MWDDEITDCAPAAQPSLDTVASTELSVIVQAAISVRGMTKPGRPYLLNPGDSTPPIVGPGDKLITVYDGKNPNVVIFRDTVMGSPGDKAFNVAPDGGGGVKMERRVGP